MKTKTFIITLLCGLIASVVIGYSVFWFAVAGQIKHGIKDFYAQTKKDGISIEGPFPVISGFPGKHILTFTGKIGTSEIAVDIPALTLQGTPLPGEMIEITLPQGLSASSRKGPSIDSSVWSLDYLSLNGPVPQSFPASGTVEALRAWRDNGGAIAISQLVAHKESLRVTGNGRIKLDEHLQPDGYFNVMLRGHIAFLGFMEQKKLIDPKRALITSSVLNGLSGQDAESGERFIKGSLTAQNGKLLLGPIQVLSLPQIVWPYKTPESVNFE